MDKLRADMDAIEDSIAQGDMSAAQVFTQMRQMVEAASTQQTFPHYSGGHEEPATALAEHQRDSLKALHHIEAFLPWNADLGCELATIRAALSRPDLAVGQEPVSDRYKLPAGFRAWLDAVVTVANATGMDHDEVIRTWPHYTDDDRKMFANHPELRVGDVMELDALLAGAGTEPPAPDAEGEAQPTAYQYQFLDPISGRPVWRFHPGPWNAQRPRGSRPLYARPVPQVAVPKGWRIFRRDDDGSIQVEHPSAGIAWLPNDERIEDGADWMFRQLCEDMLGGASTTPARVPEGQETEVAVPAALEILDAVHGYVKDRRRKPQDLAAGWVLQKVNAARSLLRAADDVECDHSADPDDMECGRCGRADQVDAVARRSTEARQQQPVSDPDGSKNSSRALLDHVIDQLEGGFVACSSCGDQEDTASLDVMDDLRRLRFLLADAGNRAATDTDEQEIQDAFVAGFICAGGDADEAADQAPQYISCLHAGKTTARRSAEARQQQPVSGANPATALIDLVEGVSGAMEHGTFIGTKSEARLKDTDAWVAFYLATKSVSDPSHALDEREMAALREDAARLDWLDAKSLPKPLGWAVRVAPAGNISFATVVQSDPVPIRAAIDAGRVRAGKDSDPGRTVKPHRSGGGLRPSESDSGHMGIATDPRLVDGLQFGDQLGECCCGETEQAWRLCPQHGPGTEYDRARSQEEPPHYDAAVAIARQHRRVYPTLLQRHLGIAYSNALQLIDHLEARGVVGAPDDNGCRRLLAEGGES